MRFAPPYRAVSFSLHSSVDLWHSPELRIHLLPNSRAKEIGECARYGAGDDFSPAFTPLYRIIKPVGLLLLKISGHPPEVLALEAEYFSILMWGGGGIVLSSAISSFFSGRGCTRTVMGCNLLANGLNILMNYWFVFGGLGLPAMGIAGAGWASVIGCWSAPLFFAISYFNRAHRTEFGTLEQLRLDRELLKRMLRFGLPAGFHLFTVSAFTVFVLLIGRLGDIAHIAGNMALSINLIAFMPMVGMGIAASILVGQYLGRKEPHEAAKCGWLALRVGTGYIASIGLTFLVIPDLYLQLFMPEEVEVDALALTRSGLSATAYSGCLGHCRCSGADSLGRA